MKKFLATLVPAGCLAIVFTFLWSSQSTAVATFSNRDLRGDYAYRGQQCCVLGRFTADGAAHITGSLTLAGGGDAHHESLDCSYSVSPDGTGAMTCTTVKLDGPDIGDTATGSTEFVLAAGGQELFSMNAVAGDEIEGLVAVAKRQ